MHLTHQNKYDYVIIGSGLFGSVFAHEATKRGQSVLVVEKRDHIGGNCHTESVQGINVHKYGPHIWHTTNKNIHRYMEKFCDFNNFTLRTKVNYLGKLYSFPINLFTLHQLWGVTTQAEAEAKLASVKIPCDNPTNLEDWALSQVGEEIYTKFIAGYTAKQWGRDPKDLPASIIKRLPIRLNMNDRYFPDDHRWEGIPIGGYTQIFHKMLSGSEVLLEADYFADRHTFDNLARNMIYTGPIDRFFNYSETSLEYRSLHFDHQLVDNDFQGNAIVNYTAPEVQHTRITEHRHFEPEWSAMLNHTRSVITREYPAKHIVGENEPYYPIGDSHNKKIYDKYKQHADALDGVFFGGRLATYNYYDMHQVVASSLTLSRKLLGE